MGYPIQLGDDDIDGQRRAEQAADLAQLRADGAGRGQRRCGGVAHQELLRANANNRRPRRRTRSEGRAVSFGTGARNKPVEHARALPNGLPGFDDCSLASEP